jgi:hypothetical protein
LSRRVVIKGGQKEPRLLFFTKITLAQPYRATEDEAKEIQALIDSLKQMEGVNAGLGFGIFEEAPFPPIPLAQYTRGYGVPPDPTVKKLVEYGPKAIPFLLDALDDSPPSKMTFQTINSRQSNDLPRNPVNPSNLYFGVVGHPGAERCLREPQGCQVRVRAHEGFDPIDSDDLEMGLPAVATGDWCRFDECLTRSTAQVQPAYLGNWVCPVTPWQTKPDSLIWSGAYSLSAHTRTSPSASIST